LGSKHSRELESVPGSLERRTGVDLDHVLCRGAGYTSRGAQVSPTSASTSFSLVQLQLHQEVSNSSNPGSVPPIQVTASSNFQGSLGADFRRCPVHITPRSAIPHPHGLGRRHAHRPPPTAHRPPPTSHAFVRLLLVLLLLLLAPAHPPALRGPQGRT
jgi:hypothetical protein